MAKKLNIVNPIDDDENGEEQPPLDTSKPLGVQANARTFGKVDLPDAGRQVARPISLDNITPDPKQPRREVPVSVRRYAKEYNVPEWHMWHSMAEQYGGKEIPLKSLLRGEGEAHEAETVGLPVVEGFMALVGLAASINRDGLANAITVMAWGMDRYVIETGERRYQAYRLLHDVLGEEKFAKIPARIVDKADVWRQAAENGSRKSLNAIGMARQLAILIMELNKGRDGISYLPFADFSGGCDREFYAQVANGVVHRIPKGASERILQATGLKSRFQIQQYRALLDIPDEVWMQADEEDWAEGRIREYLKPVAEQDMSTIVDISDGMQSRPSFVDISNAPKNMSTIVDISTDLPSTGHSVRNQPTTSTGQSGLLIPRPAWQALEELAQRDPSTYKSKEKAALLRYAAELQAWIDDLISKAKS